MDLMQIIAVALTWLLLGLVLTYLGRCEARRRDAEAQVSAELRLARGETLTLAKDQRGELQATLTQLATTLTQTMSGFAAAQDRQFDLFARQIESMKALVSDQLTQIRGDNERRLEAMRQTVEEKLHATLEQRLTESFRLVSDRLDKVHHGLGEVHRLSAGVGDLKKILGNVKTRGTWGEVQLGQILEQFLSPEQYEKNAAVRPRSAERVDFAVRLPGPEADGRALLLPIDSKFPLDPYHRLVESSDAGVAEDIRSAVAGLEAAIRTEARRIRDKYIVENRTTPFAIMFLPTEGLYSEVLRRPGLGERLQTEWRILVAGPTSLTALLTSLQVGFRTLALQKHSSEIWQQLAGIRTQFASFSTLLSNVQRKLEGASKEVDKASQKSLQIERRLEKFDAPPPTATPPRDPLPAPDAD